MRSIYLNSIAALAVIGLAGCGTAPIVSSGVLPGIYVGTSASPCIAFDTVGGSSVIILPGTIEIGPNGLPAQGGAEWFVGQTATAPFGAFQMTSTIDSISQTGDGATVNSTTRLHVPTDANADNDYVGPSVAVFKYITDTKLLYSIDTSLVNAQGVGIFWGCTAGFDQ